MVHIDCFITIKIMSMAVHCHRIGQVAENLAESIQTLVLAEGYDSVALPDQVSYLLFL